VLVVEHRGDLVAGVAQVVGQSHELLEGPVMEVES